MSSKQKVSLESKVYKGTATVGRLMSILNFVSSLVISIFLFIMAYFGSKHQSHLQKVVGKVTGASSDCNDKSCMFKFEYTFNNKKFEMSRRSVQKFKQGATLDVWVDKEEPDQPQLNKTPQYVFSIMIGIGVLLIVLSGLWMFATHKSKPLAAFGGFSSILNIFR